MCDEFSKQGNSISKMKTRFRSAQRVAILKEMTKRRLLRIANLHQTFLHRTLILEAITSLHVKIAVWPYKTWCIQYGNACALRDILQSPVHESSPHFTLGP